MNPLLQAKLEGCRTLPTLPSIAREIVRLCEDEEADLAQLSALVGKDPAIASKVLGMANTIMFVGRAGPCLTVKQAIARLGKNSVMTLSLSFTLARLQQSPKARFDYERFWRRSLLAGTAAGCFATVLKVSREEAFLAGMFQDVGMLALQELLGESYATVFTAANNDHLRLERLEREAFDADHREVGIWLAKKWQLPEYLVQTTRGSHNPLVNEIAPGHLAMVKAVAISGFVADIWTGGGGDEDERARQVGELARLWLGIESEATGHVLGEVAKAVPELSGLFELVMDAGGLITTLEQAREALIKVSLRSAQDAHQASEQAAKLSKQKEAAEKQAILDALTGLANRGHFDQQLEVHFAAARESGRPLSLLFCDVDHFKRVNDTHGHQVGDAVLRSIGRLLARCARQLDVVARYGGEEFAIILPGTDRSGASVTAERLRKMLEKMDVVVGGGKVLQVSASFGCATLDGDFDCATASELLRAADECVYKAKHGGRNRVVAHDPSSAKPKSGQGLVDVGEKALPVGVKARHL